MGLAAITRGMKPRSFPKLKALTVPMIMAVTGLSQHHCL
jgi:hypothetical protein